MGKQSTHGSLVCCKDTRGLLGVHTQVLQSISEVRKR